MKLPASGLCTPRLRGRVRGFECQRNTLWVKPGGIPTLWDTVLNSAVGDTHAFGFTHDEDRSRGSAGRSSPRYSKRKSSSGAEFRWCRPC